MRNSDAWDHVRFRDYVLRHALAAGIANAASLSRATGLRPSVISKWFSGQERPSDDSLRKVSGAIKAPYPELLVLAGRASEAELSIEGLPEPPANPIHPLAREVDQMLAPDSPLDAAERADVERLVEMVIRDHRKTMRRSRLA